MKNFDSIKIVLENNTGRKFGCMRKMGDFKSFSYMIILFELKNVDICLKVEKNFISELLFTEKQLTEREKITHGLKRY